MIPKDQLGYHHNYLHFLKTVSWAIMLFKIMKWETPVRSQSNCLWQDLKYYA